MKENKKKLFTFTDLFTSSSLCSSNSPVTMPLRSVETWRGEFVICISIILINARIYIRTKHSPDR